MRYNGHRKGKGKGKGNNKASKLRTMKLEDCAQIPFTEMLSFLYRISENIKSKLISFLLLQNRSFQNKFFSMIVNDEEEEEERRRSKLVRVFANTDLHLRRSGTGSPVQISRCQGSLDPKL